MTARFARRRFLLTALALTLSSLAACAHLKGFVKPPIASLESVAIRNPTLSGVTFVASLKLENPNSFGLKVDRVRYDLKLNGKDFFQGTLDEGVEIANHGESRIEIPVQIGYLDLYDSVRQILARPTNQFLIQGSVTSGIFDIPFKKEGEFTLKAPKLSF